MENIRANILQALQAFIAQRPGMEPMNYGSWANYREESRSVTRDRHHAEALLAAIGWRDSITADHIIRASEGAFSGRLSIVVDPCNHNVRIDYCTGQYFPTEYRRAVCSVLSSVLWNYFRDNGADTGDKIRAAARRELPQSVSRRFFA